MGMEHTHTLVASFYQELTRIAFATNTSKTDWATGGKWVQKSTVNQEAYTSNFMVSPTQLSKHNLMQ